MARFEDEWAPRDEEKELLGAISADRDDPAPRLVYADWLEERGDVRAELLRLQVQRLDPCFRLDPHLRQREQVLRGQFNPYWLAHLDPPVWCLVGNIIGTRPAGEGGSELRSGTRLFRPNAKVYLAALDHSWALLDPPTHDYVSLKVLGQHRKSRRWIVSYVRASYTMSWRVRLVHHPGAMVRLRKYGWAGFLLEPDEFKLEEGRQTEAGVQILLQILRQAMRRPGP